LGSSGFLGLFLRGWHQLAEVDLADAAAIFSRALSWLRDFQCTADFSGQQVRDFGMSGNGFPASGFWIPVNRMGTALTFE
jgi:hypothetical protein